MGTRIPTPRLAVLQRSTLLLLLLLLLASTSTAIALTLAFNEWGLLVLAVSYIVAFFLLLTGLTKWRPLKHCCYDKAGNHDHHDHCDHTNTKHDNEFGEGKGANECDQAL